MGECPYCKKEYEKLKAFSLEENMQPISLDNEGELDWGSVETVDFSCVRIDFECPHCNAIIYRNDGSSVDPKIKELLKPGKSTS